MSLFLQYMVVFKDFGDMMFITEQATSIYIDLAITMFVKLDVVMFSA